MKPLMKKYFWHFIATAVFVWGYAHYFYGYTGVTEWHFACRGLGAASMGTSPVIHVFAAIARLAE